jgi:hypothetical protein
MADVPKAAPAASKEWFPILILIILIGGAGSWSTYTDSVSTSPAETSSATTPIKNPATNVVVYANPRYGFTFSHPDTLFVHERSNGIILLPSQTFPSISSEVYALGRYVILSKNPLIGPYERTVTKTEFIKNISTEENIFEGKPTKVTWEKINGIDMLRIEHRNPNAPHTLNYYAFSGSDYYNMQMHPYEGVNTKSQEYVDFMRIVNSFHFTDPISYIQQNSNM